MNRTTLCSAFLLFSTASLFVGGFALSHSTVYTQPEQVHLSYGASPDQMMVTWVTQDLPDVATVNYGIKFMNQSRLGTTTVFRDGGVERRVLYIHRVLLMDLKTGVRYSYQVGSRAGWSSIFSFKSMPAGSDWSPQIAVLGDMGNDNPRALPYLQQEAEMGHFDAVIHAETDNSDNDVESIFLPNVLTPAANLAYFGTDMLSFVRKMCDFAYNMDTDNARVGDEFMRQLEPVASMVPYMVCVGNHESAYNFSNYRNRFTMPGGDGEGMYFSWDIGPAHIISISTELYYYGVSTEALRAQFEWLTLDLQKANTQENRALRPWIIVLGHRPMYCSNINEEMYCNNPDNPIRNGNKYYPASLEDLFYKYGVDLQIYAHEHSYERLWPVYQSQVCNGSYDEPYVNPQAPVHLVQGSAGDVEGQTPFKKTVFPWSAYHSDDYGYTRIKIHNATHLYLEEMSVDKEGAVIDKVWIVQEKHQAGQFNCKGFPK